MIRETRLRRRLQVMTLFVIAGLVLSGLTAIPLVSGVDWLARLLGAGNGGGDGSEVVGWITRVREALHETNARHPFLFYGTDWLAFGHFVIALVFIPAVQHPVQNRWLFTFGMIASALVIPWAFIFGAVRGIPIWWRLVDCSFGVFAFIPLWLCQRWAAELVKARAS